MTVSGGAEKPRFRVEKMTASEAVKQAGLKSLAELSEISGVSFQTLNNWFNSKPRLFELVLKGAVLEQTMERLSSIDSLTENI